MATKSTAFQETAMGILRSLNPRKTTRERTDLIAVLLRHLCMAVLEHMPVEVAMVVVLEKEYIHRLVRDILLQV